MKKLLTMILAVTMTLSTATVAFAAPTPVSEWQKEINGIERANHPEAATAKKGKAPYKFSKKKIKGYPYNIYVEGKGYMDFGKAKPFNDKNGKLYLPITHMAHLADMTCFWEEETKSIVLGNYYTEENSPYKNYNTDDGKSEKAITYQTKHEYKLKVNSSIRTVEDRVLLTDYGIEFLENGGRFGEYQRKTFGYNPYSPAVVVTESDYDFKVLSKNGTSYWESELLNLMVGLNTLVEKETKTIYIGSDKYISKKLKELDKTIKFDESFHNGKSYQENIEDLFKDVPDYVAPKR